MKILGIGNTIIDTVYSTKYLPIDNKIFVDNKKIYVGGQAANAIQTMAQLGIDVSFITKFGDDVDGDKAKQYFSSLGIDLSKSITVEDAATMSAAVIVCSDTNERSILMHQDNKFSNYCTNFLINNINYYDLIYLDSYQFDLAKHVAKQAKLNNIPVLSDCETLDSYRQELLKYVDILVAPEDVIIELSSANNVKDALNELNRNNEFLAVVATSGKNGSYGIDKNSNDVIHIDAQACNVVNSTGAGDAYHAGFCFGWLNKFSLEKTMKFATLVASAKCESSGSVVAPEQLKRLKKIIAKGFF